MMLLVPEVLSGAVLLRSMLPLVPPETIRLDGVPVLLLAGRQDPIVPRESVEKLAAFLREGGADVGLSWQATGHQLTAADLEEARVWLEERFPASNKTIS